jgi:glutaredoxin
MKKLRLLMVGILLLFTFIVGQTTCFAFEKKINVYLFRGEGCPHCEEAIEWFNDTLSKDSDYSEYYKLVEYEVWYNEDNSKLMNDVAEELGTTASGVPFIVIGDKYFSGFSSATSPEEIKESIKNAYENDKYQDVVAAVKKGTKINKDSDNSSIIPIVIVSAIAIVVVLGLVFFTKEKE